MRRTILIVPLLILAACGDDAADVLDPVTSNALVASPTAVVTVDGDQYRIGCPDFPCPVLPVVLNQIAQGNWVWVPAGTFAKPAIYLYALETAVKLSQVTPPTIVLPPQTPANPELTGPSVVQGYPFGGMAQIMCGNVPYSLNVPDQGSWDFDSGEVYYEYVRWDASQAAWVKTGQTSFVPLTGAAWSQVVAGRFMLLAPMGGRAYYATVSAELLRGTHRTTVSHRLLCAGQIPTPAIPPAPSLDGPVEYTGTRPSPAIGNLVCSLIGVALTSPDNGPWDFVSGDRFIEFMRFDSPTKSFVLNGQTRTDALSQADWQSLLNGTYAIDLQTRTGPYFFSFTVLVERGQYQHTLTHRAVCGGADYYGYKHPPVVVQPS
jgi:hypothetical protein